MDRRQFIAGASAGAVGAVAGCTRLLRGESIRMPPLVENRPDGVYVPTHVEGMEMVGVETVNRYSIALSSSFPHRFWLMRTDERNRVGVRDDDTVHLMASVWDDETGTVIPSGEATFLIEREGETVSRKSMWPMLSQNMGFHPGRRTTATRFRSFHCLSRSNATARRSTTAF